MKIYHWWPGRKWEGPCPIPCYLVKQAERRGSKYLTVAEMRLLSLTDESYVMIVGSAFCNKKEKDGPSRKYGRELAIDRLKEQLAMVLHKP